MGDSVAGYTAVSSMLGPAWHVSLDTLREAWECAGGADMFVVAAVTGISMPLRFVGCVCTPNSFGSEKP